MAPRVRTHTLLTLITFASSALALSAQWTQYGGPTRNFHSPSGALASTWPESGPPVVWRRELGDGYSGILVDGERLYSMDRRGGREYALCLDRERGETLWEHGYEVVTTKSAQQFGDGPAATPAIAGDVLVTVGVGIDIHAFDKESGELRWKRDLMEEFDIPMPGRGHSSSPLIHEDLVIVAVGGRDRSRAIDDSPNLGLEGGAILAFDITNGEIVWASQDFPGSKASPLLIRFEGKPQVVVFMGNELAGLDPGSGELLWSHPHATDYGFNCSTPVFDGVDTLVCSSAYNNRAEAIRLQRTSEGFQVTRRWASRRLSIHFTNMLLVAGRLYGVSGMGRPGLMTCLELETGEMLWRTREFSRANLVYGSGRFVILDEDGRLSLATFEEEGPVIHGQLEITDSHAFTAPTLVDSELYVRDRESLTRFELSPQGVALLQRGEGRSFQREIPSLPPTAGSLVGVYRTSSAGREPQSVEVRLRAGRLGLFFENTESESEPAIWLAHRKAEDGWEFVSDRTSGSTPRTVHFEIEAGSALFRLRSPHQRERTYRRVP